MMSGEHARYVADLTKMGVDVDKAQRMAAEKFGPIGQSSQQDVTVALLKRIAAATEQTVKLLDVLVAAEFAKHNHINIRVDGNEVARAKRAAERRIALVERYEANNGTGDSDTA